jgi:hypothetical protein
MANPNAPHGLSRDHGIASNGFPPHIYCIPSGDTTAYAIGDAVKSLAGADAAGVPKVIIAAAGDTCRGFIVGVVVAPTVNGAPVGTPNLNTIVVPATKASDYYVLVDDDPLAIMEIQANNTGTIVDTAFGKNCNLVVAAPGTYLSATKADVGATGGTAATTSTLQLKILGLAQRVNVDKTANAPLRVMWNTHELKSAGTAGV